MAVIGTFGSFTTARLALYASQGSLNVTGNNIANINTKGYTRQRLDLVSLNATGQAKYANSFMVDVGYGVLCERTTQLRDPFLDIRYRDKNSQLGQVEAWQNGLDQLRATFDEVARGDEDFGIITNQLHELFQSIEDLDTRTGIDNYDELVRAEADILCQLLNTAAKDVEGLIQKQEGKLKDELNTANSLLTEIRDLNKQIREHSIYGDSALELRDARNVAIDELSRLMHINVEYSMERLDQYTEVEKLTITLADSKGEDGKPIKLVDGVFGTQIGILQHPVENLNPDYDPTDPAKNFKYIDDQGNLTNDIWYKTEKGDATQDLELADTYNDEKYLMQLQPLKDEDGRYMRDEHDQEITDPVNLDDTTLSGAIQAIREMLTEEGVFASKDDIAGDPKASGKRGIPYYIRALDSLAQKFASVMNEANQMDPAVVYRTDANGDFVDADGNVIQFDVTGGPKPINKADLVGWEKGECVELLDALKQQGVLEEEYDYYNGGVLFSNSGDSNDPTGITAKNISVSAGWQNTTTRMLRSKLPKGDGNSTANENINHFITLYDKKMTYMPKDVQGDAKSDKAFFQGTFREFFDNIGGTLATDGQVSNAKYIGYSTEALDLENSRQSISGVDLNEEATGMIQFSKSYSAACRLLTTLDSMLDKLINGTAV